MRTDDEVPLAEWHASHLGVLHAVSYQTSSYKVTQILELGALALERHVDVTQGHGSGIRDPHFEVLRLKLRVTMIHAGMFRG